MSPDRLVRWIQLGISILFATIGCLLIDDYRLYFGVAFVAAGVALSIEARR